MRPRQMDEISEDVLLLFPLLKRLFDGPPSDPALAALKNHSYHILQILQRKGPLSISAIGLLLLIAKQNMTTFIDRLMRDGLVERRNDPADRRIISIVLTEKGGHVLREWRRGLQKIIRGNVRRLNDEERDSLQAALRAIKTIVRKGK